MDEFASRFSLTLAPLGTPLRAPFAMAQTASPPRPPSPCWACSEISPCGGEEGEVSDGDGGDGARRTAGLSTDSTPPTWLLLLLLVERFRHTF